jgi:hypothetical protein
MLQVVKGFQYLLHAITFMNAVRCRSPFFAAPRIRSITKQIRSMQQLLNGLDMLQHLLYLPIAAKLFCELLGPFCDSP